MRSKKIIVDGDEFRYRNERYNYFDFKHIVKEIKRATFFILNQNIYIREIKVDSKHVDEETINKLKELEFGEDEDYLIHYEISKKKKSIYMYALNGGKRISALSKYFKELRVIPIQMIYKSKLENVIKVKDYRCVFFYLGTYYYFSVKYGYIVKSKIFNDLANVLRFLAELNSDKQLYSDIEIEGENISFISLGDILNEKIFVK